MRGCIILEVVKMFAGVDERGRKCLGRAVGVAACPEVVDVQVLWKRKREGCGGREALKSR